MFGELDFKLNLLNRAELFKNDEKYYPMVLSINYSLQGKNYAYINYCNFTADGNKQINGAKVVK